MTKQGRAGTVLKTASLLEFFRDSVDTALASQKVSIDEHTSHYVVNLLTSFARSEALYEHTDEGYRLKPLAFMLGDALEAENDRDREQALRRLGDVSLFIAGFFYRSFSRRLVDVDYYISMGGRAYGTLSASRRSLRSRVYAEIFAELAENFQKLVDVLNEVADMGYAHTDEDILRLYEIWLKTGSRRAQTLLRGLGVEPTQGGRSRFSH